jgi:predicted outer membrane repeat protein
VEFIGNEATQSGGAIAVEYGPLEVYDSIFIGNLAGGAGGAINAIQADVRIERTSWYVHQASHAGGTLHLEGGATTLVNCTICESTVTSAFGTGGAVQLYANGTSGPALLRAFNCSITDNDAPESGAGMHVHGVGGVLAQLELQRTIIARNSAPTDRDISYEGSTSTSGAYNIIGVGAGHYFHGVQNNSVGDPVTPFDPMLLLPGATPSGGIGVLPIPAGPAVDAVPAGTNLNPEGQPMVVDQRLFPRALGLASDIGALEI